MTEVCLCVALPSHGSLLCMNQPIGFNVMHLRARNFKLKLCFIKCRFHFKQGYFKKRCNIIYTEHILFWLIVVFNNTAIGRRSIPFQISKLRWHHS